MFDVAVQEKTESVNIENRREQSDLIVLKGSFSTGDGTYKFELKADGTGKIIYPDSLDDEDDFLHETEVEKRAREIEEAVKRETAFRAETSALDASELEEVRRETTSEMLEEVFWEEINQRLEDPFFRSFEDESEWGEELRCERGTIEELIGFLKLCVLTEREIKDAEEFLVIEAETDFDSAGLSEGSYFSPRLGELVEIACGYFKPSGFGYYYNDGCFDRLSGYTMSSEYISVSLEESARAPAREKMLAMIELRKKLAEMEVESEKIELLAYF